MTIATPSDTYDHMLGTGAFDFSWWRAVIEGPTDEWSAIITVDNGNGGLTTATIDHATVLRAARSILAGGGGQYVSEATRRACKALLFDVNDCDFDACTADEVLQVAVLGEVVFG